MRPFRDTRPLPQVLLSPGGGIFGLPPKGWIDVQLLGAFQVLLPYEGGVRGSGLASRKGR
ncbi:hypothetical protein DZA28_23055 [Pseudomonas alloputida]|uniref:Uncharacterized protein n=1 Tax=Pseudomonas alloputida TaxID=1940621 RepID=A0ABY3DAH6_9PSED|nr:hypothetical protein DZA28_23055 [Pseudomonas alloputida]